MKDKGSSAFDDVVSDKKSKTSKNEKTVENNNEKKDVEEASDVSDSVPLFPYADVEQHSVYMRGETWESLEDVKYYAEGELREEFNVRNVETREFDESIAKLIVEEVGVEKLAEKVIELRGFDPKQTG